LVKYEIVMGIIGKTHGVSSERAPIPIASHINERRELCEPVVEKLDVGTVAGCVGVRLSSERRLADVAYCVPEEGRPPLGFSERTGDTAVGLPDPMDARAICTDAAKCTILGGKHVRSLHVWYLASIRTVLVPGGALADTLIDMSNVTRFSK